MHFMHCIFVTATVVALGSQDLFTSQEPSDNLLLPSSEMSNGMESSLLDNNDDFFTDSSSMNTLDSFELQASCPLKDGQPPVKLRGRDGVCASKDQPSIDGLINTLGVFGDPAQREGKLQEAASSEQGNPDPCPENRPFHLCCESVGDWLTAAVYGIRRDIYNTMNNCEPVPILPIYTEPRKWEVCCEWVYYPYSSEQIDDDIDGLIKYGNEEAAEAYVNFIKEKGQMTSPEGQKCLVWGPDRRYYRRRRA